MVLKLGKDAEQLEETTYEVDESEYSKMVNDVDSEDEAKGGFKNLNMMFKMENEGNPLKKTLKKGNSVNDKGYSKMINEDDSDTENKDGDDEDGDDEDDDGDDGIKVEIPDQGCCACDPQSRNLTFACAFALLSANAIIILEFVANIDDWKFSPTSEFTKGYLRTFLAGCAFTRAIQMLTLLNLGATVKRNAIYVYPLMPRQQAYVMTMCMMIHILDAMCLYIGGDGLNTWAEISITSVNTASTLHCGLVCWYQYSNGSMSWTCLRRVKGEEAATFIVGSGAMEIGESNKGVIDLNVPIDLDTISII